MRKLRTMRRTGGNGAPPLPPARLRFMGEDDAKFLAIGDRLLGALRRRCGLGDHGSVLDIGCGYGRLTHALLRSGFQGEYLGVDVLRRHIGWCERNLSRGKRIRFQHLDVANDRYNPSGTLSAAEVTIDFPPADVVVLASVLTHMWPEEVVAYLELARRQVRKGGRVYATMLLLNDERRRLDASDKPARFSFPFRYGEHCRYMREDNPLHAVAYEEGWIRDRAAENRLEVEEPIEFGSWAGRSARHLQDELILAPADGET